MHVSDDTKIDIQNLNVWFFDNHVLNDISLKIKQNAVTAIMGPSGCGKTTFIRAINRMNELIRGNKTTGEVYINGQNIYDENVNLYELRRRVGMVFQKPNPFPKSIYDNVAFG
ncbi:ATP-binding cassette domain-containing protein, partial [Candidatus Bathyarchaeota archaeon]|nr:ATP-binding cassette domain-containing protein [Candidatus Bathyarchaeota archaeon]